MDKELSILLTKEQGKPRGGIGSKVEVQLNADRANHIASQSIPAKVLEDSDERHAVLTRTPFGVVRPITPWN